MSEEIPTEYPYECISCGHVFFENPLHTKWTGHTWSHFCPKCGGLAFGKELALVKDKKVVCFFWEHHSNYSANSDCTVDYDVFTYKILKCGAEEGE